MAPELEYALRLVVLFIAAVWAGAQNQIAGGGSFLMLPALMLTGIDARAANITSTVALFPGQVTGGLMARHLAAGLERLSFRALTIISLIGGALGAVLLLLTPSTFFQQLVPWLVLFATLAFAWGSFGRKPVASSNHLNPWVAGAMQLAISIYGGYFGGGIGFLMMAAFTLAGMAARTASATKNVLAAVMNATAVVVFLASGEVWWFAAAIACLGALVGSVIGARLIERINERLLRVAIVVIGALLTIGLFLRSAHVI
ncbi:MAG TPA: sulfite exporter TauE/SafE family protein [Candidatus Limnocylindria bacterium]|nr:sulfite exporter TauE/SafE family protein [Candidatus Limnocylindria bacterium]